MRRRPSLWLGIASVAGVGASAIAPDVSVNVALVTLIVACFGIFGCALATKRLPVPSSIIAILLVGVGAFAWFHLDTAEPADSLAFQFPDGADVIRIEGTIIEGGDFSRMDPSAFEVPDSPETSDDFPIGRYRPRSVRCLLRVDSLPDLDTSAHGIVKVYLPEGSDIVVGSRVRVVGRMKPTRSASNPGEFDMAEAYRRRGITHIMSVSDPRRMTVISRPEWWSPHAMGASVHHSFHRHIGSRMSRDRRALLGAMLLGERGGISRDQRSVFVRSGTVHLLVVSGLHVGLLAGMVVLALRLIGLDSRWAWLGGLVAAVGYLVVTGIQPSVLRAVIMIGIFALGKITLRKPDTLNLIGAAALVSVIWDPATVFELGFQLSFLAVLGIVAVAPMLRLRPPMNRAEYEESGVFIRIRQRIGTSLRISLAVGICTWPLLASQVHVVSPSMFVTNLLVTPILTLLLFLGCLSPLALVPGLGGVLVWMFSALAGATQGISELFAELPYGHFFLASPPVWWIWGFYILLALLVALPKLGIPRIAPATVWLLWLLVLPSWSLSPSDEPGPIRTTVLDVGQGQCVVIEVPQGPCVVLDCGSTSVGGAGERILAPYLWQRNRNVIDALILSHPDADHVNGLPQLLERFEVGVVYVSEIFGDDPNGQELLAWLRERVDVLVLRRGDSIPLATDARLHCVWPAPDFVHAIVPDHDRKNEGGLVFTLETPQTTVLLPSDVEHFGWAGYGPQRADILLAPHQGSRVSGLDEMLTEVQPSTVIVSARETFPDDDAMATYRKHARVFATYDSGTVTIELKRTGPYEISTFK